MPQRWHLCCQFVNVPFLLLASFTLFLSFLQGNSRMLGKIGIHWIRTRVLFMCRKHPPARSCQLGQKIIVFTAHSLLSPQVALAIIISPHAFNDSLVHDSYLCKVDILMKGSLNLPFPTQRISGKNFTMPKPGTNIIEPFAFLARYIIDYPIWKIVDDSQIRYVLYQKCMKTVSIYSWKEAVKKFCNTGSS